MHLRVVFFFFSLKNRATAKTRSTGLNLAALRLTHDDRTRTGRQLNPVILMWKLRFLSGFNRLIELCLRTRTLLVVIDSSFDHPMHHGWPFHSGCLDTDSTRSNTHEQDNKTTRLSKQFLHRSSEVSSEVLELEHRAAEFDNRAVFVPSSFSSGTYLVPTELCWRWSKATKLVFFKSSV